MGFRTCTNSSPEPHHQVNIRCVILEQKVKAVDRHPIIFIAHKIVVARNYLTISNFAATAKKTIVKPS